VLLLQRALEIVHGDLVIVAKHLDALEARDVDQDAAREQRAHIVDTELLEAGALGVLGDLLAIVPAVEMGLVRKAVELGADLAELGDDDLFVRAAHVGEFVHERALGVHVETPRPEERHAGTEHVRELDHLAGLDQLRGIHYGRGLLVIGRTALVGCAPFRRTALAFRRNGPAWSLRVGGAGKRKRDRRTQYECFHLYPPKRGALETAPWVNNASLTRA